MKVLYLAVTFAEIEDLKPNVDCVLKEVHGLFRFMGVRTNASGHTFDDRPGSVAINYDFEVRETDHKDVRLSDVAHDA